MSEQFHERFNPARDAPDYFMREEHQATELGTLEMFEACIDCPAGLGLICNVSHFLVRLHQANCELKLNSAFSINK